MPDLKDRKKRVSNEFHGVAPYLKGIKIENADENGEKILNSERCGGNLKMNYSITNESLYEDENAISLPEFTRCKVSVKTKEIAYLFNFHKSMA